VAEAPSQDELVAAHCWDSADHVPRQPAMTAFRRRLRLHQARWREANGHPIGSQPLVPRNGKPSHPVGSRMPLDYARETGASLVTPAALEAARARTAFVEPHQSFDHQRVWADLLWSPTLAFNLFAELAADRELATRAVRTWWPDVPGAVREVRFAHSPGRLDTEYLGNLVDWDLAIVLDLGNGREGILGVVTAYHDVNRRQPPKASRLPRYREVMDRSRAFTPGALDAVNGTELIHIWLDHLLVHAMLQHGSGAFRWGRLVVVHPAGNTDFGAACERYGALLTDGSTFASSTIEELLDAGVLPPRAVAAFRDRYLPE
jgi:hypothetical protein